MGKFKFPKIRTTTVILTFIIIMLTIFTIKVLNIVEETGYEPSTLITAVFTAALGEFGILGWIKNTKIRHKEDEDKQDMEGVG